MLRRCSEPGIRVWVGGGHHLEERARAGGGVCPDDGRAGAVPEQRLRDEGVEGVPPPRGARGRR
jgi:hypothetical protein